MAIKYDTSVVDEVINIVNNSLTTLNSNFGDKIANDFSAFTELGLFSSQLSQIKSDVDNLGKSHTSFINLLNKHKNDWNATLESSSNEVRRYSGDYYPRGSGGSSGGGSSSGARTSGYQETQHTENINIPIKISTKEVGNLVSNVDSSTIPILLRKIYEKKGNNSMVGLISDESKSGILIQILREILGDTSGEKEETSEETTRVQRLVLQKVNTKNIDVTTEEGASDLEKQVIEQTKTKGDEEKWNKLVYGSGKVKQVSLLDGQWIVVDTKNDLMSYASYIADAGVRQDSDTSKYSDYCLAFSYVHAYDLYTGERGTAQMAGNYDHAGAFDDFINDDKSLVMQKIFSEVMSGKPVVLQVNGNRAGTSRHFVTVVGFKSGITDPSKLTEKDLLIIDSWDGKIERMDTEYSRFMTTGAQCHKEYSGYRLRVLKQNLA